MLTRELARVEGAGVLLQDLLGDGDDRGIGRGVGQPIKQMAAFSNFRMAPDDVSDDALATSAS